MRADLTVPSVHELQQHVLVHRLAERLALLVPLVGGELPRPRVELLSKDTNE